MRARPALAVIAAFFAVCAARSCSALAPRPDHPWRWMAHRGVAQSFPLDGVGGDTCTARLIRSPVHPYLENTLPSMERAFALGAAAVELDLHQSRDHHLVVFHDATLDCRTDGYGAPEDHDLAELQALDLGYGYTADGGQSWPLRGTGRGLMPTLEQVLDAFPDRTLVLHLKTDEPEDGERLADALQARPAAERARRIVYGGQRPVDRLRARLPEVRTFSKGQLKACGLRYLAVGWTGWVPQSCAHTVLVVPVDWAPALWGWPRRLEARLSSVDTTVMLVGPRSEGGWISGVDDEALEAEIPEDFGGLVWTNRIDAMTPRGP